MAVERELYLALVKDLSRDPSEGLQVIGLWLWLSSFTIMEIILDFPLFLINELADEAVKCLRCLDPQFPEPSVAIEFRQISRPRFRFRAERSETQLTRHILSNVISLHYLRGKRSTAFHEVQNLVSSVCIPTLSDLFERSRHGEFRNFRAPSLMMPPMGHGYEMPEVRIPGWNDAMERTLFVIFPRGNGVQELELASFMEQSFGCRVEMVYLSRLSPGEQPLYARVLLDRSDMMDFIVEDDNRAKYTINGKDVWIHRCVERNALD